jgi:hypothetical protein
MMAQSVNLSGAAHALHAHFGQRFSASRAGGEQRFAAVLRTQFDFCEQDAQQMVAQLARREAIQWIAEPSIAHACPGVLELCGDWIIQPDRLAYAGYPLVGE